MFKRIAYNLQKSQPLDHIQFQVEVLAKLVSWASAAFPDSLHSVKENTT